MTAFINLDFANEGANAGEAVGWIWGRYVTAFKVATFALSRFERFGRGWGVDALVLAFDSTNTEPVHFATPDPLVPLLVDGFENQWSNDQHLTMLDAAALAFFDGEPRATFDAWATGFRFAYASGDFAAAPIDGFEAGWRANEGFLASFSAPDLAAATFATHAAEGFENVKMDVPFVFDMISGFFSAPGHGFTDGDYVTFVAASDGFSHLPNGLVPTRRYQIFASSADAFQAQDGSVPVILHDSGSGSIFIHPDERVYWTTTLDS